MRDLGFRWQPRGMVTGIGSLPHRSARAAAAFSLASSGLPAAPTLPRRSPAEGTISQAVAGMRGFTIGQYASIAVDVAAIDVDDPCSPDLADDAHGGLRAFLDEAKRIGFHQPVKLQFVGPVTLGVALVRAGVPEDVAFQVAVRTVRRHVEWMIDTAQEALPDCPLVVFVDEPLFGEVHADDFFLAPDTAIDLVSAALAMIEARAVSGLHCCASADVTSLLATGPHVLSVPAHERLVPATQRLHRFLDAGGVIAWGAVPTSGPVALSADRAWRSLSALWCRMVQEGADPTLLRQQSLITPECGLGGHSPEIAAQLFGIAGQLGQRVREQAVATQFAFGA